MYTYNIKFWCKKVGVKYEQNIPMGAFNTNLVLLKKVKFEFTSKN